MTYGTNAPLGLQPYATIAGGSWVEKYNNYSIYTDGTGAGAGTYGTSLFQGDPIQINTTNAQLGTIAQWSTVYTNANPSTFAPLNPILGTFGAVSYTDATGKTQRSNMWIANTPTYPNTPITSEVADDPNIVYNVQISTNINATANAFAGNPVFPNVNTNATLSGYVGSNFALFIGGGTNFNTVLDPNGNPYNNNPQAGNTLSGNSAYYLNVTTSNVLPFSASDYDKTNVALPLKAVGIPIDANILTGSNTLATQPFINVLAFANNHVYGHNAVGVSHT